MDDRSCLESENVEDFVAHLGRHHAAIYNYLVALVTNVTDADDIMQEVSIALWRKFPEYDRTRDFCRWARGIAFVEVLRFRQNSLRDRHWFSDDVLRLLSDDMIEDVSETDARRDALERCLAALSRSDRALIQLRYDDEHSIRDISSAIGRPQSTIYKMLLRIRSALADCIRARMAQEYHPNV